MDKDKGKYFSSKLKDKLKNLVDCNIEPSKITTIINNEFTRPYTPEFIKKKIDFLLGQSWWEPEEKYLPTKEANEKALKRFCDSLKKEPTANTTNSNNDSPLINTPSKVKEKNNNKINNDIKEETTIKEPEYTDDNEDPPSLDTAQDSDKMDRIIDHLKTLNKNITSLDSRVKRIEGFIKKIEINNPNEKFKNFAGEFFKLIDKYL